MACLVPALVGLGLGAAGFLCNGSEAAALVGVVGVFGGAAFWALRKRSAEPGCGCTTPIACDLTVFTTEERAEHLERGRRVFSAIHRFSEEASGYTFAFSTEPAVVADVGRWIDDEKRCCPFFRFDLFPRREGLTLRVTGPEGAKEILRSALRGLGALEIQPSRG